MSPTSMEIQKYLDGLDYPAGKQKIIDHAIAEGAPEHLISTLNQFRSRVYNSYEDVEMELYRTVPARIENEGESMPPF